MLRQAPPSKAFKAKVKSTPKARTATKQIKKVAKRTLTTKSKLQSTMIKSSPTMISTTTKVPKSTINNIVSIQQRMFSAAKPPSAAPMQLPALSPTMEQGKLTKWHVKEGDLIKPGDLIADIETDKAVVGFESQDEYFLAKILIPAGAESVLVNEVIAVTVEEESELEAAKAYAMTLAQTATSTTTSSTPTPTPTTTTSTTPSQPTTSSSSTSSGETYTHRTFPPSVAVMLHELHINPSNIKPTGGFGHLTKGDVLQAIENKTVIYDASSSTTKATSTSTSTTTSSTPAPKSTSTPTSKPSTTDTQFTGRRRRARTFTDVQVTPATTQQNKSAVNNDAPATYESGTISLTKLHSFINTFAKECDLNAALVSIVAKSINMNVTTVNKDIVIENDLLITNKATGTKTLLSRHVATQIGHVFKQSQTNANPTQSSALFNIALYTNLPSSSTSNVIERVPVDGVMAVTIGAPFTTVNMVGDNVVADKSVQISISTDTNKVSEQTSANIIKSIKGFANEPITMLL